MASSQKAPFLSLQEEENVGEESPSELMYTAPAWQAWWVLVLYGTLSALQSLLWITYSSVPAASRDYLQTNNDTLNLWLNWGPVAFCFSVFPAQWLLSRARTGLRDSIRLGLSLCLLASLIRLYPTFLTPQQRLDQHTLCIALTHIAQFINGAVAPLAVASPSYLSLVWFPDSTRNSATALANVSNALGRAVGFFLGPALVPTSGDLPKLLYVCVACAAVPCLASLVFLPPFPSTPPSRAAKEEAEGWMDREAAASTTPTKSPTLLPSTLGASLALVRHPPFLAVAVSGGVTMALYGAWSGELTPALTQGGYSDGAAGAIGSVVTFAGILGGVGAGWATDLPALRKSLKGVVVGLSLASAALFLPLSLALPPFSTLLPHAASAWLSFPALLAVCGLGGLVRGGLDPLFFELAAETAWDIKAGPDMAGSLLTLLYHLLLCAALSIPSATLMAIVLLSMPLALLVGALVLFPVKVSYERRGEK
jgi:hypothetical protein